MTNQSTAGWAEDVFAYDDYDSSNGNATLRPPVAGRSVHRQRGSRCARRTAPLYRWIDTEATLAIQSKMHAQVHNIAQSNTAYAGLLGWAGIDYASLNGGDRIWHNIKWPGVLDTFRVPKPGAAFYRSQVDPTVRPVILPVFFWDFGPSSPASRPGAGDHDRHQLRPTRDLRRRPALRHRNARRSGLRPPVPPAGSRRSDGRRNRLAGAAHRRLSGIAAERDAANVL